MFTITDTFTGATAEVDGREEMTETLAAWNEGIDADYFAEAVEMLHSGDSGQAREWFASNGFKIN